MSRELKSDVGNAEIEMLKYLALSGALNRIITTTIEDLATDMKKEISPQTASRRLRRLDDAGFTTRQIDTNNQGIQVTEKGRRQLEQEYQMYCYIFENKNEITLEGDIISGVGEGDYYTELPGYANQFEDQLGYWPYLGTLNLALSNESVQQRKRLQFFDSIRIESWSDEDRTYGAADCYDASVETIDGETYKQAHVLVPDRTYHNDDQLEIIAPDLLRDELELADGNHLSVHITEGKS